MSFNFAKFRKNAHILGDIKAIEIFNSIEDQQKDGRKLSERQLDFLMSLALRNSDAVVAAAGEYSVKMKIDNDFREDARIIAEYYKKQLQYYKLASTAMMILKYLDGKSETLPSYSDFKRIRDNKYAKNVLDSSKGPSVWGVGDLVNIRASCNHICWNNPHDISLFSRGGYYADGEKPQLYEQTFMIIAENSRPIVKSLKYSENKGGCRYYKLMPLGMSVKIDVMERDLKKPKKVS
tara:strand:- start:17 stop:724 length:708 start_codon:yes stop_codon:yes gene_type:complete